MVALRRCAPGFDPQHKEIGILLESKKAKYSDPFFNAVLEGTDRKLQELGYRIAYINTGAQVITADQARDLLRSNAVSGMIVVGPPLGLESIEYFKANVRALVGTARSRWVTSMTRSPSTATTASGKWSIIC